MIKQAPEICHCMCHTYELTHETPCCKVCDTCKENIITIMYDFHVQYCTAVSKITQEMLGSIEEAPAAHGSADGQSLWIESMAETAGMTVIDIGRMAGIPPTRFADIISEDQPMTAPEMAAISSVVLDGHDATEVAIDMLLSPVPVDNPATQAEWILWARSGLRRTPLGQKHMTLKEIHRRTGIPADHIFAVEKGTEFLTAEELDEVARALKVEMPQF